jgi:Flp pilus assembly protein TadG
MSRRLQGGRRFLGDEGGAAAVEFVLVAPIFCLLLAGIADVGGALYVKFRLNSAVAAASNFAQVNAGAVGAATGPALATNIAALLSSSMGQSWADATVVVNNGPQASVTSGVVSSGGSASQADLCYCPSGTPDALAWGAPQTCKSNCPGAGTAGKFVTISASRSYSPMFASYGLVQAGQIRVRATVQTQ